MSKKGNKKIILQSEKLSNVKYHGKPMMQYSYVASKGVTNDEIKAFLRVGDPPISTHWMRLTLMKWLRIHSI